MSQDLTPEASFEQLKKNTVDAIKAHFPDNKFEGKRQSLLISNIHVDDKLRTDDVNSQSDAKDKESTWGVPVKADIKLIDKATGKTIDEKKGHIMARLPKITNRYGFIVGGNEYQVDISSDSSPVSTPGCRTTATSNPSLTF
jgi:DNA-directed RNA polymerase beta subunit